MDDRAQSAAPGGLDPARRHPAMGTDGGNLRVPRHAQLLARWPVIPEAWAREVEERRIAGVDTTPGPASFGR